MKKNDFSTKISTRQIVFQIQNNWNLFMTSMKDFFDELTGTI